MFAEWIIDKLGLVFREAFAVRTLVAHLNNMFTCFSVKGFFASLMVVVEMVTALTFGAPTTPRGQQLDLTGYNLVMYDDFNGSELNLDVWEHRGLGARRGGFNGASQASVKDGNLYLAAEYTDGAYGEGWYTGMIKLKKQYVRGYFEIKCICNSGDGFWSAFWIQAEHPYEAEYSKGGVGGAEIDIFESLSYGDFFRGGNSVSQTIHCAGVDGATEGFQSQSVGKFYANNIYEEYNTYGLEWTEDEYIFYINGVETNRTSFGNGVSQVPEDVIVSLEIPGEDQLEKIDKSFRTEFIVDYVKIYQK